jgi:prophage antirepressor-like protein
MSEGKKDEKDGLDTEVEPEPASATATAATSDANPLVALFFAKNIRLAGSVKQPLFCALDVARHIGDTHYGRFLADFSSAHRRMVEMRNARGHRHEMLMLTERGLYKYLLRSKRPEAEAFQEWTFDLIAEARLKLVDAERLAAKLAHDQALLAAHSQYRGMLLRASDLEEELREIRRQEALRPYRPWPDHSWVEYQEYCLTRYKTEASIKRLPTLTTAHKKEMLRVVQQYWDWRDYEEGYDQVRKLLDLAQFGFEP